MQKTWASGNAGCDRLSSILSITQGTEGSEVNFPWILDSLLIFFPLPLQLWQEAS